MSDSNKVKNQARLRKAKRRLALHKYAESSLHLSQAAIQKLSGSKLANGCKGDNLEGFGSPAKTSRPRQYIDAYGSRSYNDFYRPLCEFFGDGTLTGVTLVGDTTQPRKKSFRLKITWANEKAKRMFQQGKCVKIIITDESIGEKM
ncbi:hypothetical protein K438DRAFT_1760836 [Mycena galopus ATCC 62051]|nr:hypothetical protein K438DRAFT_1760836 [Mycena galopus ATCC 62051]